MLFANGWRNSSGYKAEVDYLRFFEEEYDCSGICEDALFYFSQPLSKGKPKSCFADIKNDVRDSMWWLGVAGTISGLILLLMFIC